MLIETPRTPEELAAEEERRVQANAERWPVVVGVTGTVIIHLLLYYAAITFPFGGGGAPDSLETLREKYDKQELTFLLADPEPPPEPMRFVETNPDAPENDPGQTPNFGAQNQQAAQPEPGKDRTDRPKTEGELDESTAIVTGSRTRPAPTDPLAGAGGQNGAGLQAVLVGVPGQPKAEQPLPGFEKFLGENPEGLGSNLGKAPDGKPDAEKEKSGSKEETGATEPVLAVSGGGVPGAPGRPAPRPRPKLQNVRPAVLANQPLSVSNAGVIGVDARFSEFGDYLQEFIDTVDAQWQKIVGDMTTWPPSRSIVRIHFKLNSQGEIAEILDVVGEDTAGRAATYACLDAIRARAPYRPWTKEMVAVLGTEQEITFSFLYR